MTHTKTFYMRAGAGAYTIAGAGTGAGASTCGGSGDAATQAIWKISREQASEKTNKRAIERAIERSFFSSPLLRSTR